MTIDLEWLKKPVQARTVTILELTLECETLRAELRRLRSEREGVRAETIEECAKVAETPPGWHDNAHSIETERRIAKALRSLSAPQAQGGST